jgi:phosphoserine phosphatase
MIVDLDGTLTPTDTLIESIILLIKRNPLDVLRLPFRLLKGRAAFKAWVASRSGFSAAHLPYRASFVDYLRNEKDKGRQIILATASDRSIADAVADHIGLFDGVLASDGVRNLKGTNKLQIIREKVDDRFVYAGDSTADLPIWNAAEAAILVGTSRSVAETVRRNTPIEREFPRVTRGGGRLAPCATDTPVAEESTSLRTIADGVFLPGSSHVGEDDRRLPCFLPCRIFDLPAQ